VTTGTTPREPSVVGRAQRLFAFSSAIPLVVFGAAMAALIVHGHPQAAKGVLLGSCSFAFLAFSAFSNFWGSRNWPDGWRVGAVLLSYLNLSAFLITMFQIRADAQFQLDILPFSFMVAVLAVVVVLTSWVPAHRGRRLILDDLSADVVNSSLVIRFNSRVMSIGALRVTPDSLKFAWRKANGRVEPVYPLADVSAVAVRREARDRGYLLPGGGGLKIDVTRGDVVVVDLPEGQLVFPAKEPERLRRFVEDRCRALVGDG
jgi:hypothetical protein